MPQGFWAEREVLSREKLHDKPPQPLKQSSSPKTLHEKKKLRQVELWTKRESLQKNAPRKNGQHFPP